MNRLRQDPHIAEIIVRTLLIAASFALAVWLMR